MTTRVTSCGLFCSIKIQTCGSEPCHNFPAGAGFDPPESFERRLLADNGERGVVGVEGVDSLAVSSDAIDSGGGDGL